MCKKNARDFVALPEQVFRSADLKLASSEAPPPPRPPDFNVVCGRKGGIFVLQNKRPLLFSAALISVRPYNCRAARPSFQTNIEIGGRGVVAACRKIFAELAGVFFANTGPPLCASETKTLVFPHGD